MAIRAQAMFVTLFSGLMHLRREIYRNAMHIETVMFPGEVFNMTFVSQLMFGTCETSRRNETVHVLRKITQAPASTVRDTGVTQIPTNTGQ
jgi:hypothetical protein